MSLDLCNNDDQTLFFNVNACKQCLVPIMIVCLWCYMYVEKIRKPQCGMATFLSAKEISARILVKPEEHFDPYRRGFFSTYRSIQ